MPQEEQNGNGHHVRINLNIPAKLNDLLLTVIATEQVRHGKRLNRHKFFKASLIEYARRRRIPIPKGL